MAPTRESLMPRPTRESPMWRASGTERASRSSFGTTRVSLVRTAARAWSRPGRARLVPMSSPIPEPILMVLLLAEELEHACPGQAVDQRGGLLLRARLPQPVHQPGHAVRAVE